VAHFGVAEGACFTYSIGFLAPTRAELVESFLGYLGAARAVEVDPDARYEDPDLKLQREPLDVSDAMVERVAAAIGEVAWDAADVGDFLGRFLTRPRPRALFRKPARPMTMTELARRLRAKRGQLSLALPTRGLLRQGRLYVNGEAYAPRQQALALLRQLFRQRTLPLPVSADERTLGFLHEWYAAGYLEVR
jgi:50S ribosomal protein L16 3-hydroxylase